MTDPGRTVRIDLTERELALITIACAFYGTAAAAALQLQRDPTQLGALVLSMMEEDPDPKAQLLALRAVVEKIGRVMGLPPPPPSARRIFG